MHKAPPPTYTVYPCTPVSPNAQMHIYVKYIIIVLLYYTVHTKGDYSYASNTTIKRLVSTVYMAGNYLSSFSLLCTVSWPVCRQ